MPIKAGKFFSQPPPPVDEAPSFFSRLRNLAGIGTRAVTGVLAAEGGLPGAAIAGAGELGAELIEGSDPSWKRMAAESTLGLIPFGAVFKAGRPLASAARGAAFGASGSALRQIAEKGEVDPVGVGTGAALGGAITGGLAKFFSPKAAPVKQFEVETTAYPGGRVLKGGKKGGLEEVRRVAPIKAQGEVEAPMGPLIGPENRVQQGVPGALNRRSQKIVDWETKEKSKLAQLFEDASRKRDVNEAALADVERAKAGLEPKESVVSETTSGTVGSTRKSATKKWAPEIADKAATKAEATVMDDEGNLAAPITESIIPAPPAAAPESAQPSTVDKLKQVLSYIKKNPFPSEDITRPGVGPKGEALADRISANMAEKAAAAKLPKTIEPIAPTAEAVPSALAKFFKTKTGATGLNYRLAKEAAEKGEIPSAAAAREAHMKELEISKAQKAAAPPAATPHPDETPDWVQHELGIVDKLKALAESQKGEKGEISPAALQHLLAGGAGALIGGAVNDEDPFTGAVVGAGLGLAAPSVVSTLHQIGANPDILHNLKDRITTPEGLKKTAASIWETLPQIQRFNYLTSGPGMAANMWAGPYGSALFAGIEHALSGDPRGTELLKQLANPLKFGKLWKESLEEASELIGRAEGTSFNQATGPVQAGLSLPGLGMTAGDVAARKILTGVGFTEEEARRITLTAEPELPLPKKIADFGKGSALAQLLFPFKRTPANILEQGAERLPGIGSIVQEQREVPDSLRQQLVQQGLSAAVGTGSYALGNNLDPETAKIVRRFVSNFGGQYSMPASMGFAMGQAAQQGKPVLATGAAAGINEMPLPTLDTPLQFSKWLFGEGPPPAGVVPGFVKELTSAPAAPPKIRPLKLGRYK